MAASAGVAAAGSSPPTRSSWWTWCAGPTPGPARAAALRSPSRTSRTPTSTRRPQRPLRARILRAVDDVNALDPQPDFVLYGGDLAQLGQPGELELGAQILNSVKAP